MQVLYSRKDETWKLADFGYTTQLKSRSQLRTASARGTEGYFPPEFFAEAVPTYDTKVDIWSMGCILFELAMTKRAFETVSAIVNYRTSKIMPSVTLDEYFSPQDVEDTTTSIRQMLNVEPTERPTATDLTQLFTKHLEKTQQQPETTIVVRHDFVHVLTVTPRATAEVIMSEVPTTPNSVAGVSLCNCGV
jgi:serine/threonine protein kinase